MSPRTPGQQGQNPMSPRRPRRSGGHGGKGPGKLSGNGARPERGKPASSGSGCAVLILGAAGAVAVAAEAARWLS